MQAFYRNYPFLDGGTNWVRSEQLLEENGVPYGHQMTVAIIGDIEGASPVALEIESRKMTTVCRIPSGDLILRHDGVTLEGLYSAGSLLPVRCVSGPNFAPQTPGDFTKYRSFNATFSAMYPPATAGIIIIELSRSITRQGGGAVKLWRPAVNGPAQLQIPYQNTAYMLIQSGYARSRGGPVPFPAELYPSKRMEEPYTVVTDRITPTGIEYVTQWRYTFGDNRKF